MIKLQKIKEKLVMFKEEAVKIAPKIILSLVSIFLFLIVVELMIRILISSKSTIPFIISSYETGYQMKNNFEGVFSEVPVNINSQGFRQKENVRLIKESGTVRIIGLGDSVAFGFGVEEDKTFLHLLGKILNSPKNQNYEVINAAVSGYNTFQERKYFEQSLIQYKPDILILSFVLNDISGDFHMPNFVYRTLSPFKQKAYSPKDFNNNDKLSYLFFRKSLLYQFIYPRLVNLSNLSNKVNKTVDGNYSPSTLFFYKNGYYREKLYSSAFEKTTEEIFIINKLSKSNNIKLVLVIFPVGIQLEDKTLRKPQERLISFCKLQELFCLDLIDVLEKEKEKKLFNDEIGHPNEYASEVIAKEIARYLRENKIL